MSLSEAVTASARFGMGASPGELDALRRDPRAWAQDQLNRPDAAPGLDQLPDGASQLRRALEARRDKDRDARIALRQDYLQEAAARTRAAALTTSPLRERLVRFWSNHFTVSVQRPLLLPLAGAFEREAIRPHVGGRFIDLLRAVVHHPAMLVYLDNAQSIGPESPAGLRRGKGLNENLARELMELHTLGVDGGYAQADVEQLARILTGWSIDPDSGGFRFIPRRHQPGDKTMLGRSFRESGQDEGERALEMLARHPATARLIATKLTRHFVADAPPPDLIAALSRRFQDTDGDLTAVMAELLGRDESWTAPPTKMRSPDDLLVAVLRAFPAAAATEDKPLVGSLRVMGQAPWTAPSPAGWPDRAEAWAAPEALMLRLEWMRRTAPMLIRRGGASAALELSSPTRAVMASADSQEDALFLALASPEFQRR